MTFDLVFWKAEIVEEADMLSFFPRSIALSWRVHTHFCGADIDWLWQLNWEEEIVNCHHVEQRKQIFFRLGWSDSWNLP